MTILEALKAVLTALGGNPATLPAGATNADVIAAIATAAATVTSAATTKELPAVTGSNNGQVLTVYQGAWKAKDLPAELPAVTAENNGEVLTVDAGAWKAKALPST